MRQILQASSLDLGPLEIPGLDALEDLPPDEFPVIDAAVTKRAVAGSGFSRDQRVRAAVQQRAAAYGGYCEACGQRSFQRSDGSWYLETHHVLALADGGKDSTDNVAAVCPQCHREAHYGVRATELEVQLVVRLRPSTLRQGSS